MRETECVLRLLSAYQSGDHATMAACYHTDASFEDIAFRLQGRRQIQAMWHMICENGIEVIVDEPPRKTNGHVIAKITDKYLFSDTKRQVVNPLTCSFRFCDGLIIEHRDDCDPIAWAKQAFGGVKGWLAGRVSFLRRSAAQKKISRFIALHREYQ